MLSFQRFYFYSSIPGKELILIIELITETRTLNCHKTVGWLCLPLIDGEELESNLDHLVNYK